MISDRGCLEFAKQFLIKKGRVNISLVSVPMVRALVHSLSLAPAIRGEDPFFIREWEWTDTLVLDRQIDRKEQLQ